MDGAVMALENEPVLVARAVLEPAAFAAIYEHYFPLIYNYLRYRLREARAAEDVTSQVFERALVKLRRYQPERGTFAGWLFGIAHNAARNHLRAASLRRWLPLDFVADQASRAPRPEETTEFNETWDRVLAAVTRLGDRERDLIGLKFGARLTNRQIAEVTGLSESNVSVIVYRAVRRLRTELGEE